MFYIKILY